jgi:hypothetical protein
LKINLTASPSARSGRTNLLGRAAPRFNPGDNFLAEDLLLLLAGTSGSFVTGDTSYLL